MPGRCRRPGALPCFRDDRAVDVVEFWPEPSQYAWTFGGAAPTHRIAPGTVLRLWTEDAFSGRLRRPTDRPSEVLDIAEVNPQTGPFHVEGAEPGDTLALHVVDLVPARDWGASTTIPFFGALTGTDRTALLQEPLPELTWIYQLDRDRGHRAVRGAPQRLPRRAADRPDARHGRCRTRRPRGAQLAGARQVRRQHGHPRDARRNHRVPGGERRGRVVLRRRRALPAGRGGELRHGRRGRHGRDAHRRADQGRRAGVRPGWSTTTTTWWSGRRVRWRTPGGRARSA